MLMSYNSPKSWRHLIDPKNQRTRCARFAWAPKNLLGNNSTWDFEGIVDTMNPYWFLPDKKFCSQSSGTRFFCTSNIGAINDNKFIYPTLCIRENFRLQTLGLAEFFFAWKWCPIFIWSSFLNSCFKLLQRHLDLVLWGQKFSSG